MGIFLGIIGDIVFIASVLTMKDSWRVGVSYEEKTDLITDGIYQISRNPAFLGFNLAYLGMCLMFFNINFIDYFITCNDNVSSSN